MMFGILSWILFGLIVGIVAKLLTPGGGPRGCFVTVAVGIVGAAIGGGIGALAGFGSLREFSFGGFFLAVIGAVIFLLMLRAIQGRPVA